jgi:hypothetical protein
MRWPLLIFTCDVAQQQAQDPCKVDLALLNCYHASSSHEI